MFQASQGYTARPCLKDRQSSGRPWLVPLSPCSSCLVTVEGPWVRSDILLNQFCINFKNSLWKEVAALQLFVIHLQRAKPEHRRRHSLDLDCWLQGCAFWYSGAAVWHALTRSVMLTAGLLSPVHMSGERLTSK